MQQRGLTKTHKPLCARQVERNNQQQCAAVGQSSLMALYDSMFKVYGMGSGQVLINVPDLQQAALFVHSPAVGSGAD